MFLSNKKDVDLLVSFIDQFDSYIKSDINSFDIPEESTKKLKKIEDKIVNLAQYIKDQKTQDIKVFGEVMLVCEKLSDGFTDDEITEKSSDAKINYISKTIN
ncbi:MAG: chemotaxis protein, partial [Poseidonibacter sp.]